MQSEIFIGPTYYMRLKHMVKDKINYRAKGPRTVITRQTVQGRANDGGLRVGEQERDAIVAHGLSYFLQESLLVRGDEYFMAICNLTGMIAIYNTNLNLFMSPFADGPIKYVGELDDTLKIDKITRFGRSFSVVRVPYAFKLLLQELSTLNINIRIITADNVDQLSSMAFGAQLSSFEEPKLEPSIPSPSSNYLETLSALEDTSQPTEPLDIPGIGDQLEQLSLEQLKKSTTQPDDRTIETTKDIALQPVDLDELTKQLTLQTPPDSLSSQLSEKVEPISEPTETIKPITEPTTETIKPTTPSTMEPIKSTTKPTTESKNNIIVVDDPNAPDELEEANLLLLTDIENEQEEENKAKEKSVVVT